METAQLFDSPVHTPQEDLLEMQTSARELARQIPTLPMPFTIGIYGEWGTGKTSFVKLVESFLDEGAKAEGREVVFADFTAWPHRTSDELWRALILCIAKKLYKVKVDEEASDPTPKVDSSRQPGFLDRLASLLRSEAAILHAPPPPVDPFADYKRLVARLDRTAASCDKGPDQAARLDQEQAMLATVQGAIAALGSLSPLVAGLRGLLGLNGGPRAAELLQRDRNEATRERIESIQDLRDILRDLFRSKDKNRCVCVFIDDLDRCMPDVALDLLEAIKIFFTDEVRCVFLVAADAQLIGRGLQLRFKELVGEHAPDSTEQLFARKGQEYFEKIIQLGIPVPQPTPEQIYRLIAAQFPRWLPAGDILRTAIGDNPRRLKQYCNLLQYRLGVAWAQSGKKPDANMDLLEDLIRLRSWGKKLTDADLMSLPAARTLDRLADIRPHLDDVVQTRDAPFLRIFRMLELPNSEQLIQQDLTRLVGLRMAPAFFLDALGQLAENDSWMDQMLALEKALDDRVIEPPQEPPLEQITVELFQEATFPTTKSNTATGFFDLRAVLIDQKPRLSSLLPEEVQAFLLIRETLPKPEQLLTPTVYSQASETNKNLALAAEAWKRLTDRREVLLSGLDLRLRTARHFLDVRRFAKLDALRHCWPHIERLLRAERWTERVKLLALERQALGEEPQSSTLQDEKLASFLKLRPYFRDVYPDDHRQFLKAVQATEGQTSMFLRPTPDPTDSANEALSSEVLLRDYESATLRLCPVGDPTTAPEGQLPEYEITLTYKEKSQSDRVTFNWLEVTASIDALRRFVRDTAGLPQQRALTRDIELTRDVRVQEYGLLLRELGEKIYNWVFPENNGQTGKVREFFLDLLDKVPFLRLLLDMSRPELMVLPWECLYIRKPLRNHLVLSQRCSLVRYFPPERSARHPPLPPLRILAMFPRPSDAAPLNLEGELKVLERSLAAAAQSNFVQLQVLQGGEATVENLSRTLRVFQPHIFHFVGHGLFMPEPRSEGALVCESADGHAFLLQASTLATFLKDSNVQLAVLNACDTGAGTINDAITGVAGALVNAGLPAVIATLRLIYDEAGLLFTREFYRAFVEGCPLEIALTEARKILSAEKWDWTAYALFTNLQDLDFFRLSKQAQRKY